jgi:hypothetical protein
MRMAGQWPKSRPTLRLLPTATEHCSALSPATVRRLSRVPEIEVPRLAGIRLFDIKCAWFSVEQHWDFFPRSFLANAGRGEELRNYGDSAFKHTQ